MDLNAIIDKAKHLDPASLAVGAVAARTAEAAIIRAIKPIPALLVSMVKLRVKALESAGKIDSPTMRMLKAYGRATFAWANDELPEKPGPEKMEAVLNRLAAIPYLGVLVRVDRAGVQEILQAAYDAVKAEAKAEAAEPSSSAPAAGGASDAQTNPPPAGGTPAPTPAPKEPDPPQPPK